MNGWQLAITVIVAAIAAIPPTITALAALRAAKVAVRQNEGLEIQGRVLAVKADEIHDQVNSNLEQVRKDLREANDRLDQVLRQMIDTVTKAAATTVAKADTPPIVVDRRDK